jgi:hypothetical protein
VPTPTRDGGLRSRLLLAGVASIIFGGCAIEVEVGDDPARRASVATIRPRLRDQVDVLFVVDDRATMASARTETAQLWTDLRERLRYAEGNPPSVHVGIVSADVGVGYHVTVPGCTDAGGDGALVALSDGQRWLELTPDDTDSDATIASTLETFHDEGCAIDQPLLAMERALGGGQPLNDGFRRADAALVVVMVAGDDDCSVSDPSFFDDLDPTRCHQQAVTCDTGEIKGCGANPKPPQLLWLDDPRAFLERLVPDADARVITGVIGAPAVVDASRLAVECPAKQLYPGVRMRDFVREVNGVVAPSCDQLVRDAAAPTAPALRQALGHHCLREALADTRSDVPDVQPDCIVDAIDRDGAHEKLPKCANPDHVDGQPRCYAIVKDPQTCGDFADQLAVRIHWDDAAARQPDDVTVDVSCVLQGTPQIQ